MKTTYPIGYGAVDLWVVVDRDDSGDLADAVYLMTRPDPDRLGRMVFRVDGIGQADETPQLSRVLSRHGEPLHESHMLAHQAIEADIAAAQRDPTP